MRRKQTTRSALITSCISLLLCVSMLVGTTFAWFTDEVVSGNNQILAGNLDVDVYYGDPADKNSITGVKTLFKDVELWEPGAMAWEQLTIINLGTLALKYNMSVSFNNGTDIGNGETLADILQVAILNEEPTRENIQNAQLIPMKEFSLGLGNEKLLSKESKSFYMAIYWEPSDRDNDFNMNNGNKGKELSIDLGIHLYATQLAKEEDSFDKYYDETAAVFTVKEANELLEQNKDVNLVNCNEPEGILVAPANYTGTLTLVNTTIKSVQAAGNVKIVIVGDVVVNAKGSGVATVAENETTFDGSAITANGTLTISGTGNLTAIAADVKAAFGIGGMNVSELNISGVHIVKATGAGVNSKIGTNYGKQDFEGAPAIGSGYTGAVITLNNVTVDEALGGSKGAGIGARYHTGVTINITDSIIKNVVGGSSSAGIGGSRMTKHMSGEQQNVTINITNSIVNATGGDFGAGIGSGYNTYTTGVSPAPVISVTIDAASQITAQGGWLGAGIGTGHNAVGFVGNIACDISNVKAGSSNDPDWCCWGAPCTPAQDVGFGVLNTNHYSNLYTGVSNSKGLADAIADGETEIYLAKGEYTLPSLYNYEGVTIIGVEGTVIGGENVVTGFGGNFGKNTTIKNVTFTGSDDGVWYSYANGGTTVFENCVFAGERVYGFHIDESNSATFVFNNCTFSGFNAFAGDLVKVTFNNCTFLHNGRYGHTNIWSVGEFNNCTWGDKASVSPAGDAGKLFFDGVEESYHHEFVGSAESLFAFADSVNNGNDPWAGQKIILVDDIDLNNVAWTPIGQTGATQFKGIFDGQGHTIKNLSIDSSAQTGGHYSSGLFGWLNNATVKNLTIENATVIGNHNVGVIAGYMETTGCTISNCHVINATVAAHHANGEACGDKVGVIVGHAGNAGVKVENCTVKDSTVSAGRDAGQVAGAALNANVVDCTADNVAVSANGECTGANVNNAVIGRVLG